MAKTLKKKLTNTEYQKRVDQILGGMHREVSAFQDTSEAAKAARRESGKKDVFWFFRTYLPHYFNQPEAPFHHELIEMVDQRPGPEEVLTPVALAAPREFAKTTVISFGYVLHQIYYRRRHFIIIGSDTEDLASDITGYLYLEMLYNERLRCDFGEMVREYWGVDDFVTLNDIRLKARGRGQRVVGRKHKQFRPDLIILDDMENDINSKSPDQVRKLTDWVLNAVYPSIDSRGTLLWIGTIWARKSALEIAVLSEKEPWCHWVRNIYRAFQEDGSSLWPARYSVAMLLKQKKAMGTWAFNKQKMNDPRDEDGMFQEGWIKYYRPADLEGKHLVVVGFFDPSLETGSGADFKAIITIGLDMKDMEIYVLDAYIRRDTLDKAMRIAFMRHKEYSYSIFGVEDNLFQRLLLKDFDRMAKELNILLPHRGVTSTVAKETRVAGISPYVERGKIKFQQGQSDQDLLIEQLLYFPSKTVHDDGPDALEGAVTLVQNIAGQVVDYESLGKTAFGRIEGAW